ncbi:dipeptidase [Nocardioides sp. zg-536]|uniref:Dipeptidase n=1 Tax=Nocardioides faecalis TaxID=2803858 RepID=A0A938Y6L7_9ACTN|nr:dipeptidase [Nocardioides faecalis]MBM9458466.1 dipeptidase [Nocardioides faecalis]QVI58479.1 dipeptidase [Nocardioides faecalis]
MTGPVPTEDLRTRITELLPGVRADLEALVRIPSVSADPARRDQVEASARATAELFAAEGVDVEIVRAYDGAPPAVIGHRAGPEGAPTVLLYAHHDVQPENDHAEWDSPPWEPTERDGRLYARGAADDKAGVLAHVAALRAFGEDLPVSVKLFIEGEEEVGSDTLPELLATYRDRLAADVIVIADSGNWDIGVPALTTSLRGLVRVDVEVRTLTHAVHSGMWGGLVPDALITLSRLIATLHDDRGDVAVEGLVSSPAADVDYPEERLRAESGAVPGIEWIGTGSAVERLWTKPALSITGLDAPKVEGASNTLVPAARAKISLRVAPGDTTANALACLQRHLEAHVPWGAELTVTVVDTGEATRIEASGPAYDAARSAFAEAWDGTAPVDMGVGGSIPFIAEFLETFPEASVLVTGVEDPDTRAHGANEGLHLAEFERVLLAEALLLRNLGAS